MTENKGDLISREALKEKLSDKSYITYTHEYGDAIPVEWVMNAIDNAPTVERPQRIICKTCKYYYPYYKQFSSEPRGDGYCGIQRMTPEGIIHINCNDEFGCLDYQKGDAE